MRRLRHALGPETEAMMQRHEAQGSLDHPEYEAAITLLYCRHICRTEPWPEPLNRSFEGINMAVYEAMWGAQRILRDGQPEGLVAARRPASYYGADPGGDGRP